MTTPRRRLNDDRRLMGDLMVEAGIASRAGVTAGLEEQRLRGGRLGFNLVRIGEVLPISFHFFLQDRFPILLPELAEALTRSPAVDLVPPDLAHHYFMVPVRAADGVLDLAIAGADSPLMIRGLQELTGLRVEPLIVPPSLIADTLARFYPEEISPGVIYRAAADNIMVLSDAERGIRPLDPDLLPEDAPATDWLRGIVAQGIERRARRIQVDPQPEILQIWFQGAREADSGMSLPVGASAGVASLIEGLSGIARRPRTAPREGRLVLEVDRRRVTASILANPGFDGHSYSIDLREERVAAPSVDTLRRDLPGLVRVLDRLVEQRHGLLVLAGPGTSETEVGLGSLLSLLGEALPRRIALRRTCPEGAGRVLPESGEEIPLATRIDRAVAKNPDLLIAMELGRAADARSALALSRDRVVIASVFAADAFEAAERISRLGQGRAAAELVAGILGIRLLEALCSSCRVAYDLLEVIPPGPRHRSVPVGDFAAGTGCMACRGSGTLELEPVFEFISTSDVDALFRPGVGAPELREERLRSGETTLIMSALQKASAGLIDVREPLRLLLHERH